MDPNLPLRLAVAWALALTACCETTPSGPPPCVQRVAAEEAAVRDGLCAVAVLACTDEVLARRGGGPEALPPRLAAQGVGCASAAAQGRLARPLAGGAGLPAAAAAALFGLRLEVLAWRRLVAGASTCAGAPGPDAATRTCVEDRTGNILDRWYALLAAPPAAPGGVLEAVCAQAWDALDRLAAAPVRGCWP